MKLTGYLNEIGALMLPAGFSVGAKFRAADGRDLTLSGLNEHEVRSLAPNFMNDVTITVTVHPEVAKSMPPHLQRVAVEFAELSENLRKLRLFMQSSMFEGLDVMERHRQITQAYHMTNYARVLAQRVWAAGFSICDDMAGPDATVSTPLSALGLKDTPAESNDVTERYRQALLTILNDGRTFCDNSEIRAVARRALEAEAESSTPAEGL